MPLIDDARQPELSGSAWLRKLSAFFEKESGQGLPHAIDYGGRIFDRCPPGLIYGTHHERDVRNGAIVPTSQRPVLAVRITTVGLVTRPYWVRKWIPDDRIQDKGE